VHEPSEFSIWEYSAIIFVVLLVSKLISKKTGIGAYFAGLFLHADYFVHTTTKKSSKRNTRTTSSTPGCT